LDELFETMTLIQTRKIKPFPVVLFGTDFWRGLLDWISAQQLSRGMLTEADFKLLRITDDIDEAVALTEEHRSQGEDISPP
ncbi:MAG: LOG family protein, partial [Candidatus Lambdaproteobacteria bacterium]|nr:LOG family protein [Candidatus Lambdaproteobacteria bacterium]